MGKEERLQQQFAFCREIDKEKRIKRQTYQSDAKTRENDAEHAWHMAVMAILLEEYSEEKIDLLKTVTMLLIHDLVEIDAGDTYAYDPEAKKTQKEREKKAADRIFSLLPPDQGERFRAIWEEFEAWESPEACFAHTLDNVQPAMLNDTAKGISWKKHGVRLEQILERNRRTGEGSEILWKYARQHFIEPHVGKAIIPENCAKVSFGESDKHSKES